MRYLFFLSFIPCVVLAQEVPPKVKTCPQAVYPASALAAGVEGSVEFSLSINASGAVTEALLTQDPGYGFAESAQAIIKQCVFAPATKDGAPLASQILYRYTFTLARKDKRVNPFSAPLDLGNGEPPSTVFSEAEVIPPGVITGTVFERGTRDPIPYAQVALYDLTAGLLREVTADEAGQFTFVGLVPGVLRIKIAAVGYESVVLDERVPNEGALLLTFRLLPENGGYGLTVRGDSEEDKEVTRRVVSAQELEIIPGARGDVLKAIQNLPGLSRTFLGLGGLIVRGSAQEDTQVFLDGMPVPIIYHFGGLASVISEDFISALSFTPGVYSAKYGRGMGGIIDAETSLGEPTRVQSSIDIDVLDTGVAVKGAIKEYDLRYAVAARRSYLDVPLALVQLVAGDLGISIFPSYRDYQAAVATKWKGGETQLLAFGSSDKFEIEGETEGEEADGFVSLVSRFHRLQWSWKKEIAPGLSRSAAASFGRTDSELLLIPDFTFKLRDYGGAARIDWASKLNDKLALRYGADLQPHLLESTVTIVVEEGLPPFDEKKKFQRLDAAGYVEAQYNPSDAVTITPGLRLDWLGVSKVATVAPRLALRWNINPQTAWKTGAGVFHQDPKAQDFLGPDSPAPHPQYALQAQTGVERGFWDERLSLDVSVYYKRMYRQTVRDISLGDLPAEIITTEGEGRVAGAEFLLRYPPRERFFGWIAYSLSTAQRRETPTSEWLRFESDQPHNITSIGAYKFNRDISVSWRFRVVSGNPYTPLIKGIFDSDTGFYNPFIGPENAERLPAFHQLDLRVDKTYRKETWRLTLYLEVLNVYNHRSVEFEPSYNFNFTEPSYDGVGLPIIPVLGLEGEF